MDLKLDISLAKGYKSTSQIARILTESWVKKNAYCPGCGCSLSGFENNRPVADFLCVKCKEEFELKSKNAHRIGNKIVDGAYYAMIERIQSENSPNFFFLTYNKKTMQVINFLVIPYFYFVPGIIEKRKALSKTARRSGWVGCSINLSKVPKTGRIFIVEQSKIVPKNEVRRNWQKTVFLKERKGESRGWLIDVMNCVDRIPGKTFSLRDVYEFEMELKAMYPNNNFIRDKIRQQLQVLRDEGLLKFLGNGKYEKTNG